ncbi:MAG: FUN14 domain-containing protein [Trueperaceae bacterium]
MDIQPFIPYIQQLGFGGIAGFVVGYALKKVGKIVAIALGVLFVILQILAYYGFVSINWIEVQDKVDPLLETNSLNAMWQGLLNILTHNFVAGLAFVPGLILGLKRG